LEKSGPPKKKKKSHFSAPKITKENFDSRSDTFRMDWLNFFLLWMKFHIRLIISHYSPLQERLVILKETETFGPGLFEKLIEKLRSTRV
jgi:hypothetical protein